MKLNRVGEFLVVFAVLLICLTESGFAEDMKKKHPFFPSLFSIKDGRAIKSSDFTDPEECGDCHEEIDNVNKSRRHNDRRHCMCNRSRVKR